MSNQYVTILTFVFVWSLTKQQDSGNAANFNVVIFLAKTSSNELYMQDSGIKYLDFVEKTRVKRCGPGEEDANSYTQGSECKQLLKAGIYSLISFCRNVMGMTTAIASTENDTFSNGLRLKKSQSEDLEVTYHNPRSLQSQNEPGGYITEPEHTEVFKIRSKRQSSPEYLNSAPPDNDQKFDIFNIVANLNLTFFGKLLGNEGKNQGNTLVSNDQLGKVSESTIFDLVKQTLGSLQESGGGGFLMVVLGGCLKEVSDIYSSLMQSVKHVVENTDEKTTLIVVTGSCPPVDEPTGCEAKKFIPVYVRGPLKACAMTMSDQLYDVPYAIKNWLSEMNGETLSL